MRKFYASLIFFAALFSVHTVQAQSDNDKVILDLIKKNAAQLRLSPADAENAVISSSYTDKNIQYVYLQQTYQHVRVFNSIMTVIFRDNQVLYSSGKFVDNIAIKANASSPAIPAEQALSRAAQHLRLANPVGLQTVENKFAAEKKMVFSAAGIAKKNIETELFWVASDRGDTVRLAWNVNIDVLHSSDWWNVRVDAATGQVIEKNNWTIYEKRKTVSDNPAYDKKAAEADGPVQFNETKETQHLFYAPPTVTNAAYYVNIFPSESPRHQPMGLDHEPWLRAGAGNAATTDGWHFDGTTNYNITRGNNVFAYLDVQNTNAPNSTNNWPDTSTTADPSLTFNFVPTFTQLPGVVGNKRAAITNLFYWNNLMHDVSYQYGFNEVSGNFQTDNLGRGGVGNDYVQAEGQDASGTDNANFATPADGSRPRMQMFLFAGVPTFTVNTPAAVAGNYFATESGFSTANKLINTGPVTGQVIYYNDDGTGTLHQACVPPVNSVTGKIAMIDRGICGFTNKVKAAQDAGAKAVIMVNNAPGFPITMGGTDNTIIIPAVMISQSDGALLAAQLANNLNVTLAAGVNLDGDLDDGVVSHEYTHGISTRLTGGPGNANCLSNLEQGGEGWSDYVALMMTTNWGTAHITDGNIPRPMGVYVEGQPLNGTGIRTFPYCYDMTVNPHTYTDVANPTFAGEVHYIGEIWTSAIWDMTWNIIQQEGTINPNLYDANGAGGNVIALKLVIEGMRLQTCRPGFLDARDGILAADSVLYGSRHKCSIWNAFARRGMGYSAVEGSSNSTTDQVAAFDVPSSVVLNKGALPLQVAPGENVKVGLTTTCQCQVNTNYTIRDTIPAGFTYLSSTGGTVNNNVVTFSPINFSNPLETKTYSITLQAPLGGCAITTSINDNRDASTTGGLTPAAITGATQWVTSTARSSSPTTSWFAADVAGTRDFTLTSNAFTAGNLSVFSFKQYYVVENLIDAGKVEYSTDNGTTWLDAGPFMLQNGYNATTLATSPWGANQRAFTGVSYGKGSNQFITTVVNFSSLKGQSVRVRFHSRSNANNASNAIYEGWFVDDVLQMDGCGGIVKAGLFNGSNARADSLAVPLFVTAAPAVAVTTQPLSQTACAGSTVVFTVAATPLNLPTYQWQLSTDGGTTWNDIAGQTSASLTLTGVTVAMSGNMYRAVVFDNLNSSGSVNSAPATLTVNPVPTVNAIANVTVCNASVVAAVTVSGAVAGTVYSWTNSNAAIGLAATGTGNIPAFTAINTGTTPITSTVTITPSYTNAGKTCTGTPLTYTITVNPQQVLTVGVLPGRICVTDTLVQLVGAPVGGSWSGLGVSGFNFIPPSVAPGTYTLTYSFTNNLGCLSSGSVIALVQDCQERIRILRQDALILYPNPNSGRFNIRINSSLYNYLGMRVYTMDGKLVILKNFSGLVYGRVISIDLTMLPADTYLVKFYYDDGIHTDDKEFKVVVGGR